MSVMTNDLKDRITGCLLGHAIGNALGARYVGLSRAEAESHVNKDILNGHLPILGGGYLELSPPGRVTTDTECALAMARSIARQGTYKSLDVCNSYCNWYKVANDIGGTTRGALQGTETITEPEERYQLVCEQSRHYNMQSLSYGCLMRISPLAIAGFQWSLATLLGTARADCYLTHPNLICQDSVITYITALYAALHGNTVKQIFRCASEIASINNVKAIVARSMITWDPADEHSNGAWQMTYVGAALQTALYELFHYESFEKSLVNIIKRGAGANTHGCITGALLGAVYGRSAMPADWVNTILTADLSARTFVYPDSRLDDLPALAVALSGAQPPEQGDL